MVEIIEEFKKYRSDYQRYLMCKDDYLELQKEIANFLKEQTKADLNECYEVIVKNRDIILFLLDMYTYHENMYKINDNINEYIKIYHDLNIKEKNMVQKRDNIYKFIRKIVTNYIKVKEHDLIEFIEENAFSKFFMYLLGYIEKIEGENEKLKDEIEKLKGENKKIRR